MTARVGRWFLVVVAFMAALAGLIWGASVPTVSAEVGTYISPQFGYRVRWSGEWLKFAEHTERDSYDELDLVRGDAYVVYLSLFTHLSPAALFDWYVDYWRDTFPDLAVEQGYQAPPSRIPATITYTDEDGDLMREAVTIVELVAGESALIVEQGQPAVDAPFEFSQFQGVELDLAGALPAAPTAVAGPRIEPAALIDALQTMPFTADELAAGMYRLTPLPPPEPGEGEVARIAFDVAMSANATTDITYVVYASDADARQALAAVTTRMELKLPAKRHDASAEFGFPAALLTNTDLGSSSPVAGCYVLADNVLVMGIFVGPSSYQLEPDLAAVALAKVGVNHLLRVIESLE